MKTSELTGAALDWAVHVVLHGACEGHAEHEYSTDWAQGGPIIDRERITLRIWDDEDCVHAYKCSSQDWLEGPTPLIAAMRCYVASMLGDEVDVPEELQ
jgi:hypothetical protein